MSEYTAEQLSEIGRRTLVNSILSAKVRLFAMRALAGKYSGEYCKLKVKFRAELRPRIEENLAGRDMQMFGMKVVESRRRYAEHAKAKRTKALEVVAGSGPVSFVEKGYWTRCSCGHIAQEHCADLTCGWRERFGAALKCVCEKYDGKWVIGGK